MDTPDPVTGLTEREKNAVRDNWAKITSSWKTNGIEFFGRLFETYPVIKAHFKTFEGMDMADIKTSSKLRAHAINFKHGITSFVENLDDPDCLVVLVHKMTANHFRRQIRVERFQEAFTVFLNFAQDMTQMDTKTADAWRKTLDLVSKVIGDHIKELEQQTDGQ